MDTDVFTRLCPAERERPGFVLGRVSRADPGKWSALAWEMFALVAREVPEARYHILGMIPEAREYFRSQGLLDRVKEVDPVVEDAGLADFLNGVSVSCHANDTGETFGLVIAEAMAAGLPVITHPCDGWKDNAQVELVRDGETGFVARGAEEYAACAVRLLRDPDEARRMGEAGRARAREYFEARNLARDLGRIYSELLRKKGIACDVS